MRESGCEVGTRGKLSHGQRIRRTATSEVELGAPETVRDYVRVDDVAAHFTCERRLFPQHHLSHDDVTGRCHYRTTAR